MSKAKTYMQLIVILAGILLLASCGASQDAASHEDDSRAAAPASDPAPVEAGELDWCAEHAVPESECTKCNPGLIAHFKEINDWCAGHDLPESHCRLCNPGITFPQEEVFLKQQQELLKREFEVTLRYRQNAEVCATNDAIIQLASEETAERAGISVQTARAAAAEWTIEAPAEIVFDETASTVIASSVPALVSRWLVSPGDTVDVGAALALVKSPGVAELKSKLLAEHAHFEVEKKELERHRSLHARKLISEADLDRQVAAAEQARVNYRGAEGMLLSAGLSQTDIDQVTLHGDVSNEFILRAPVGGLLVDRIAKLGELLDAGRAFATLADPGAMWIEARLEERDLGFVTPGQELVFSSDDGGLSRVGGKVIWVSRFLDQHTRKGTVRAQVVDPRHRLHAGAFGRVRIAVDQQRQVTVVPKDAVQWEGCCNVVFVREAGTRYRPRKVELTSSQGPYYQVTGGVRAGEDVVVDGSFLLKTELKKSSIGAGCCGLDPVG